MIPYNQLSLADIFAVCQEIYESDKPQFLSLLQQHIDLDEIVPASFRKHFYASTGRSRKYPLNAFLWALIIQRFFSIPTDSLLLVFLRYSRHLREFCGFDKVPDASKITRFKQDFLDDIQTVFARLVDLTEPICQEIDSAKADMAIFDSSGIEAWVAKITPSMQTALLSNSKLIRKPCILMTAMIPTRPLTLPCPLILPQILTLSSFTLTGISVMPINSAL